MAFLDWLSRGRRDAAKDDGATPETSPWDAHPSIYEHIKAHIRPVRRACPSGKREIP
jgi:hypothetical protein